MVRAAVLTCALVVSACGGVDIDAAPVLSAVESINAVEMRVFDEAWPLVVDVNGRDLEIIYEIPSCTGRDLPFGVAATYSDSSVEIVLDNLERCTGSSEDFNFELAVRVVLEQDVADREVTVSYGSLLEEE